MPRSRLVLATLLAAGSLSVPGAAAGTSITVLHGRAPLPAPLTAATARALTDAQRLAAAHPHDLSFPWAAADAVVVATTTPYGNDLARTLVASVPVRTQPVTRSYAALERLHETLTTPLAGIGTVIASHVEPALNRVVVDASALTPALRNAVRIAGTDAVAVRVVPGATRYVTRGRGNDVSPYSGGNRVRVSLSSSSYCTGGFPWQMSNTTYAVVTAGHCFPHGGDVYTPASSLSKMGTVISGSGENWTPASTTVQGTQYFPGQSTYRGDLARIDIVAGKSSAPRIFVGTAASTATNAVVEMATIPSQVGDQVCMSGATSGELCGFSVYETRATVYTDNGKMLYGVRARKTTAGCTQGGDSGAPVFVKVNATVIAKGILSNSPYGGCEFAYTDIWDAWAGFGGFVQMTARTFGPTLGSVRALQPPHYLVSPDGRFVARMQLDGNFVLYKPGNIPVWSTRTNSTANRGSMLEMQADGNLVLYKPGHTPIWSTGTYNRPGAYLDLQNDCNLVVYQPTSTGRIAVWKSNTIYGVNC